jgi:hypothetical protein
MPPPKGNQPELPEWWKALRVPPRLADRLLSKFTLTRDGYVLWYAGKTRRAAPKSLPPAEVDAAWEGRPASAARNRLAERSYHNLVYELNRFGEFEHRGRKVADMPLADIGPPVFSGYARKLGAWKASGFDSVVSRVSGPFVGPRGRGISSGSGRGRSSAARPNRTSATNAST